MALSNSQYNELMRIYEQRQLDAVHQVQERYERVTQAIPEFAEIDNAISSASIRQARLLLNGETSALADLKQEIHTLSARKKELLKSHGYPAHYLEPHYLCPDCKDTGYIGTNKCHCFKKAIVDLLYTQSNLQEILKSENFSTLSLDYYSRNHIDPVTGRSSLDSMKTALHACHEFVDTFSTDFRNILLYGDTGVGKTAIPTMSSSTIPRTASTRRTSMRCSTACATCRPPTTRPSWSACPRTTWSTTTRRCAIPWVRSARNFRRRSTSSFASKPRCSVSIWP